MLDQGLRDALLLAPDCLEVVRAQGLPRCQERTVAPKELAEHRGVVDGKQSGHGHDHSLSPTGSMVPAESRLPMVKRYCADGPQPY